MTAIIDKDVQKMNAPFPKLLLASAMLCVGTAWSATDSVANAEKTLFESLRTMDFSNAGVLLTGDMRSSINSSTASLDEGKHTGLDAYTEGNFVLQARPTKDTRATVMFRAHQDWQKSHEEGMSPYLFDWWSYDGKAVDGKINFNLGDMRVRYTPLTLATPVIDLVQEPELLATRRAEAMAYRHLDGTDARLLQGLNFSYASGQWGVLDNLYYQGTGARLRNQAKKPDQVFFDFDESDRYMLAGRAGAELGAFTLGGNYVWSFDREKSARNYFTGMINTKSILLEDNSVLSVNAGVDLAKLMEFEESSLALDVEYALSSYESQLLYKGMVNKRTTVKDSMLAGVGQEDVYSHYLVNRDIEVETVLSLDSEKVDGSALLATLRGSFPRSLGMNSIQLRLVMNDKNFQSDLAQSPVYYTAGAVLNSQAVTANSAVNTLRASSMENLYYTVYTNDPLTQLNIASGTAQQVEAMYLYNNYRKAHNIRSGYTNASLTRNEMLALGATLDPAVNLSMPYGVATPNRKGVMAELGWKVFDNHVAVDLRVNSLSSDTGSAKFMDIGVGASADVAGMLDMERRLYVNVAFEQGKETDGYERSSTRMSAGLALGLWKQLSLLGAFQIVDKDYGKRFGGAEATGKETLMLVGPELALATGSSLNVQYGFLNNELKLGEASGSMDRTLVSADIRVKF